MSRDPRTFEQFMARAYPGAMVGGVVQNKSGSASVGALYDAFVAGVRSTWDGGTLRQRYAIAAIQGIMANPERWRDIQRRYDKGQMSYDDASISNAKKAFNIADHMVAHEEHYERNGPTLYEQLVLANEDIKRFSDAGLKHYQRAMKAEALLSKVFDQLIALNHPDLKEILDELVVHREESDI